MPVAPDIARDMAAVPVTERSALTGSWANEGFALGTYRVTNVDRSGVTSSGWSARGHGATAGRTTVTGGYSYNFNAPLGVTRGECSTELAARRVDVPGYRQLGDRSKVGCRCVGGGLNAEVVLEGPDAAWEGQAMLHGFAVPMRAIDRHANGVYSPVPLGYEVRGQVALGAVETKRPGRVWLARNLDALTHAELACLFSGYLLFESPWTEQR